MRVSLFQAVVGVLLLLPSGCFLVAGAREGPQTVREARTETFVERTTDVGALGGLDIELDEQGDVVAARLDRLHATDVPEPAREAVAQQFASSWLIGWSEVIEDNGSGYFEALVDSGGVRCRVAVEGSGQIGHRLCEVPTSSIPPEVSSANDEAVGPIVRAERFEGPFETFFVIEREGHNRVHHLEVSPDGEILNHTVAFSAHVELPYLGAPISEVTIERPAPAAPPMAPPVESPPPPVESSPPPVESRLPTIEAPAPTQPPSQPTESPAEDDSFQ